MTFDDSRCDPRLDRAVAAHIGRGDALEQCFLSGRREMLFVAGGLTAYAPRSLELELTKHDASDLAGQRFRQVGDELDAPRVGVG
jgi:hypothetical protein